MNIIKIDFWDPKDAAELLSLAQTNDGIDAIKEKNFSGDITTLELYITLGINILTTIVSIINTLIQRKKVSSLKINGDSIEINNVSQQLVEKILTEKLNQSENNDNNNDSN